MIGVDTNVLLRLLIDDHREQSAKARTFFAERSARDPAYVSATVLAELIWLLRRRFHYSNEDILGALRAMASTEEMRLEHGSLLRTFLNSPGRKASDVADAMIGWSAMNANCEKVVTFDKRSAKLNSGMELLA